MGLARGRSQAGTTGERHRDLGYPRIYRDERQTTREQEEDGEWDRESGVCFKQQVRWKAALDGGILGKKKGGGLFQRQVCAPRNHAYAPGMPAQSRSLLNRKTRQHSAYVPNGVKLRAPGWRIQCNTMKNNQREAQSDIQKVFEAGRKHISEKGLIYAPEMDGFRSNEIQFSSAFI